MSVDCGLQFVLIKNPSVPEMKYNIVDKVIPAEFLSDGMTGPGSPEVRIIKFFSSSGNHWAP